MSSHNDGSPQSDSNYEQDLDEEQSKLLFRRSLSKGNNKFLRQSINSNWQSCSTSLTWEMKSSRIWASTRKSTTLVFFSRKFVLCLNLQISDAFYIQFFQQAFHDLDFGELEEA
jgi:hypothetical protein